MDVDALLARVIGQARAVGIPVPGDIDPHVTLNTRAVARFGCCVRRGPVCRIELAARLIQAGEAPVLETLAHEVLHACRGCRNHGEHWRAYAQRMNEAYGYRIQRTATWESMGLADEKPVRHLLVCESCGREFRRARSSPLVEHPERYRCKCGGHILRRF